jgi:hypothetical protein
VAVPPQIHQDVEQAVQETPSRASTKATRSIRFSDCAHSSATLGISVTGRLSMQKNPKSSRQRLAALLPAPDIPVTTMKSMPVI